MVSALSRPYYASARIPNIHTQKTNFPPPEQVYYNIRGVFWEFYFQKFMKSGKTGVFSLFLRKIATRKFTFIGIGEGL